MDVAENVWEQEATKDMHTAPQTNMQPILIALQINENK